MKAQKELTKTYPPPKKNKNKQEYIHGQINKIKNSVEDK